MTSFDLLDKPKNYYPIKIKRQAWQKVNVEQNIILMSGFS